MSQPLSSPELAQVADAVTASAPGSRAMDHVSKRCSDILRYQVLGIGLVKLGKKSKIPVAQGWTTNPLRDPEAIKNAFNGDQANVGLLCGETFWVLDIDAHNGGLETLEAWEKEHGKLNPGWITRTPRGGFHYFFACTPETAPAGNRVNVGAGIDVRTKGGQVAAHPSTTEDGPYKWDPERKPFISELTPAPQWLLNKVSHQEPRQHHGHQGVIHEGTRNATLFKEACRLRGLDTQKAEAERQILAMNSTRCSPPLPESEVLGILDSAYTYPPNLPPLRIVTPEGTCQGEDAPTFPHTDLGNAERLIHQLDKNVRWCHALKKWLWWNGNTWQASDTGDALITQAVARMIRDLHDREFGVKCESRSKINNCVEIARQLPGVSVTPDDFDKDPWKFAVANGTVNLNNQQLEPPCKEDLITQCSPVVYDPSATCPLFERFLNQILQGDQELITYLQVAAGYTLTGLTWEHCLFFAYGSGANGKSTFIDTLRYVMGTYAATVAAETFTQPSTQNAHILASIKGARLVTCNETSTGKLQENVVKMLSDGSTIKACAKYGHPFEFKPTAKYWWAGNQKPTIVNTDEGIWRRMRLIPFEHQVPREERDQQLPEKLMAEASGILNWALQGLAMYLSGKGLPHSQKVEEGTQEYRTEMDTLQHFITDACDVAPNVSTPARRLYQHYQAWCKATGLYAKSEKLFSREIQAKGFTSTPTAKFRRFDGIQPAESGEFTEGTMSGSYP